MDYSQYFATLGRIHTRKVLLPSGQIEDGWDIFATSSDGTNDVARICARKHGYHPVIEMTVSAFFAVNGVNVLGK